MCNEAIYIPKSFAIKVRLVSLSILLLFHTNEVTQVNVAIPAFSFVDCSTILFQNERSVLLSELGIY